MSETLFLSTVTGEFGALRSRLARFLQRIKRVHVRHQDDFFNRGVKTLRMLEEEVTKSNFVVHLIGAAPGWTPPADQVNDFLERNKSFAGRFPDVAEAAKAGTITATQWEAWLALFLGKRLYSYEIPSKLVGGSSQKIHSERLCAIHQYPKSASDEDALFEEILGSLIERGLLSEEEIKPKFAPSRILRHSPPKLFGREKWLDALDEAWAARDAVNVYTLVAWGGVGKTSLVAHWVANRMPKDVERYFDWSFYSQGTGESRQTSSDLFIAKALEFFGDPDPVKGSPWDRGERLAGLIRQHRTLLVLDGIEPLQYPELDRSGQAGRLKDQALEALLVDLAQDNPGLCLLTTREEITTLQSFEKHKQIKLDELPKDAGVRLLKSLNVQGTEEEMVEAWKHAHGHALTLNLLGRYLVDAYQGDIRKWREIKFEEADNERQGRSAFKVMDMYVKWMFRGPIEHQRELAILRMTGLFDRPMPPGCIEALRQQPPINGLTRLCGLKDVEFNGAVSRLVKLDLLSRSDGSKDLDAHPLIREYFAKQLKEENDDGFRAAHSRLFDYLCKTTPQQPDTLEGLQPLYQAVVHGCRAGRHSDAIHKVYDARILRGTGNNGFFSLRKLGAISADLAAVAAFFDEPWAIISKNLKEPDQSWLLHEAAFRLRALGRLSEAIEPMRIAANREVTIERFKRAAAGFGNLCELQVTLGRLPDAVADGRRSIVIADQTYAFEKMVARATTADALFQMGQLEDARLLFIDAEKRQQEREPESKLLYSMPNFRYCDLLLAIAERSAWRKYLVNHSTIISIDLLEIEHRAANDLNSTAYQLLDIALNHLTLARARLYTTILVTPQFHNTSLSDGLGKNVVTAINGLREAGAMDFLPFGLLTAALYHHVISDTSASEKHLSEAQRIAKWGPMPLHLADVHLHRARLLKDKDELAKAKELIHKHGYGRRYEELADAEEAAKGW